MKRRDFLRASGYFVAVAALGGTGTSCGDDGGGGNPDASVPGTFSFPQGVASGDPREQSVMLWTRVAATNGAGDAVEVTAEVADSADFTNIVVSQAMTVGADSDHTLRLLVTGLAAGTHYYYRFTAGVDTIEGRTRTAPLATDDSPVRFAWVSCQDYEAGFYGAYRELLKDDAGREEADKVQFVVHLGDFIYETRAAGFQDAIDENFEPIELRDANGEPRKVPEYPSGGGMVGDVTYANTLEDYRHIYKTVLSDRDLREARARWPFIQTWDDHEFTNDAWQSMANYTGSEGLDEPSQARKVACNQAWFEFIPAQLTGAEGVSGVTQRASDFAPVEVDDVAFTGVNDDNLDQEANNLAAVGSMTIYRSLRFGKNIELVLTDQRSYRSDHAIPEEVTNTPFYFDRRNVLPKDAVLVMDAGRTANGGSPPDTVDYAGNNVRKDSPPGTMLGAQQKTWLKETLAGSDAVWKIWGNEVPMMRMLVKNEPANVLVMDRLANADAWDGYNTERNELMQYIRDQAIDNVVVITGDYHANFAGHVMHDHDVATPEPVCTEFIAAGIASNSLFSFFESAARGQQPALVSLLTYDATASGGEKFVKNLNLLLLHGTSAAEVMAQQNDLEAALAAKDPEVNPHMRYADTDAQGFGMMRVTSDAITTELVTINRPIVDTGADGPGIHHRASFTQNAGDVTTLTGPTITGTKPFPFT